LDIEELNTDLNALWLTCDRYPATITRTAIAPIAPLSSDRVNSTLVPNDIYRAKIYSLAAGEIALVIGISPIADTESRIGVQIHPAGGSSQLPGTIRLRLLTANGSEIGQASAAVTEIIQFQFRANAGEQFQIEIACTGQTWTESFELQAD
jgi:hypothetical protein